MLEGTTRYWEVLQDTMEYRGVLQGTAGNCGGTVGYYRYCRALGVLQGIVGYCWALGGIGGYWRVLRVLQGY